MRSAGVAGLITVRTEVVMEVLVVSMARAVAERMGEPVPDDVEAELAAADTVLEQARAGAGAAATLARAGWHARAVELERFARARESLPLLQSDATVMEQLVGLARREPLERPAPDDDRAITWRIPGPGGHVRHYLALRAIEDAGLTGPAALKRCWVLGFLVATWRSRASSNGEI
jgi:hypothetical protein